MISRSIVARTAAALMGRIDATTEVGRAQINTILVLLQEIDVADAKAREIAAVMNRGDSNGNERDGEIGENEEGSQPS